MPSPKIGTSILQRFLDVFQRRDVDAIMSFFAEDCVMDMPRGPDPGGRRLVGKQQVREGIESRSPAFRTSTTATTATGSVAIAGSRSGRSAARR